MENFKLNTGAGDDIKSVSQKAKEIAIKKDVTVEFDFNGKKCLVNKNTNLKNLLRDYSNSWIMEWEVIGAESDDEYSDELKAEIKRREEIAEEKAAKRRAEYEEKTKREAEAFAVKVKGVEMEFLDKGKWEKCKKVNSDGYGKAVVDYAEGWAKLMQIEVTKGKTVAECYNDTQKGLGFLGITGFQYGCVVSILAEVWKYGNELRKAHNKEYGVSEDTKGTVNPAILTIG